MAIKDSIRDSGVASSQNSVELEFHMTTAAAGSAWVIAPSQKEAGPRVLAGVNKAFTAAEYSQVLSGPFGDVSTAVSTKAAQLATKFVAQATTLNWAIGGIAGNSLKSVVAVEVKWYTAAEESLGAIVHGPADEFLVVGTAISGGADLVLDKDAGVIAGKVAFSDAPAGALKASITITVKL